MFSTIHSIKIITSARYRFYFCKSARSVLRQDKDYMKNVIILLKLFVYLTEQIKKFKLIIKIFSYISIYRSI